MSNPHPPARVPDMSIYEIDRPKFSRLIGWRQFIYAAAVLALSYAAFGPPLHRVYEILPRYDMNRWFFTSFFGLIPGINVVFIWGVTWMWKSRPHVLFAVASLVFLSYLVFGAVVPPTTVPREAARRSQCKNNLKQIGLALHNYHDDYGTFPPAFVADEHGEPMHSWRVLLLPYLDQKNLYGQYKFDEPWDSPSNQRLAERVMPTYSCPSHRTEKRSTTTYHILVGAKTMWPGEKPVAGGEITDGMGNTLAVVELNQREVNWMDPRPVTVEEFMTLYETSVDNDLTHTGGTHALFADGGVRFVSWNMSPKYWRSLLTKSADDMLPESAMQDPDRARRRSTFNWKNWRENNDEWFAAAFLIAALLPLPWVWIKPRREEES